MERHRKSCIKTVQFIGRHKEINKKWRESLIQKC